MRLSIDLKYCYMPNTQVVKLVKLDTQEEAKSFPCCQCCMLVQTYLINWLFDQQTLSLVCLGNKQLDTVKPNNRLKLNNKLPKTKSTQTQNSNIIITSIATAILRRESKLA